MVLIAGDVMYSIDIPGTEYRQWRVWFDWRESDKPIVGLGTDRFGTFCMERYPEVLGMDGDRMLFPLYRRFVFESESHYHWFLLRAR